MTVTPRNARNAHAKLICWCDGCNARYEIPSAFEESSEFVLRSTSLAHHATLSHEDAAYEYIYEHACTRADAVNQLATTIVKRARRAFGEICDRAPDGTRYSFYVPEHCPRCGAPGLHWGPAEDGKALSLDLPEITHRRWDALTEAQRLAEISNRLSHPEGT